MYKLDSHHRFRRGITYISKTRASQCVKKNLNNRKPMIAEVPIFLPFRG